MTKNLMACALAFLLGLTALNADEASVSFKEVWAYLSYGEETYLKSFMPISDLCYFCAEMNAYGELVSIPDIRRLSPFTGRKHLVVAETSSYSLTHLCIDPTFGIRDRLIMDIAEAAKPFDGVQIDFEAIPSRDRENFVDFLGLLKKSLGNKTLSVALPAKLSESGDVLSYSRIAAIVDRVIVMAYDEHWSTSEPGPIASMDWCTRVAAYARTKIESGKLVMGLPFYGRAWAEKALSRAYKHSGVDSILKENDIIMISRENGVPWFEYRQSVLVKVFYDDAESILARLRIYGNAGIGSVAFWRLGQEDPGVWRLFRNP